jgi:hypothetical protein
LETYLKPGAGFKGWSESVLKSTVRIVAFSRRVRSTITLTTGLNPDESIHQLVSCVSGRPGTEASANHIAPVTPGKLSSGLLSVAAYEGISLGDAPGG